MGLLATGIAFFYYYRFQKEASWTIKQRRLLFSLRALGLFLLLFILINIVWETINYRKEKPLLITIYDQSASLKNYKDSVKTKNEILKLDAELKNQFSDRFDIIQISAGEQVDAFKELKFNQRLSDLSAPFQHIRDLYFNRNIGGIVLVSDGNFNKNVHPMYEAQRIELSPVFTIGVGDTTVRRDVLVRSVNSNEVAFLGQSFPVQGIIDMHRLPKGPVRVSLMNAGKTIQTITISCENQLFDQKELLFSVEAKTKGFQRFTIQAEVKPGEFSNKNNAQSCFVEVVDNKSNIVLLSSAPHPDIAAIREVLEEDAKTKIEAQLTSNFKLNSSLPNLVVWYENGISPNAALFNSLLDKNVPIFLIVGPNVTSNVINSYGLSMKLSNQQEDAYPVISKNLNSFQFTNQFTDVVPFYLPVRGRFGSQTLPADAEVVLVSRVGSIVKNDPLLFFTTKKQTRLGVFLGEGLWRWKIKEYAQKQSIDGFREFLQKIVQYLSVKQNTEPLRVTFPRRFNIVEDIDVKAEFYNESMELITTPEIKLKIKQVGGKSFEQGFSPLSNFYKASLGKLNAGTYVWEVSANYKGKKYLKRGDFVVDNIEIEALDNVANFSVLNQLSKQSNGKFFPLSKSKDLIKEISNRKDLNVIQFADSGYTSPIDWWWMFALLILLFSLEWFLRRWYGNY